jgi:Flp pilus assembly protein TadG
MRLFHFNPLRLLGEFVRDNRAQVAVTLSLLLLPLSAVAGGAIDVYMASNGRAGLQDALDSAALDLARQGPNLTSSQYQSTAQTYFNANFHEASLTNPSITATYDPASKTAVVSGSATYNTSLLRLIGVSTINVTGTSTAQSAGKWPVCVDITSPLSNHTLLTSGAAHINFSACMVQVNTANWDAVEARNTSYIHSANGDNCFVGNIHYGDVLPAKDPTCTMFSDPFSSYVMPASSGTCDVTNAQETTAGQTLQPGTYCGGMTITANATLSPGVYIMKDGGFWVTGGTVTGNGVTIIFTGNQTLQATKCHTCTTFSTAGNFMIENGSVVNLTADTGSDAGQFAGFVFYFDTASTGACHPPGDGGGLNTNPNPQMCEGVIQDTSHVTLWGITYMVGGEILVGDSAHLDITDGSLMTGMLAAIGSAQVTLTADGSASTSSQIAMEKQGTTGSLILTH